MTAGLEEGFRKVIRPAVVAVETVIKSGGATAVIGQSKGGGGRIKRKRGILRLVRRRWRWRLQCVVVASEIVETGVLTPDPEEKLGLDTDVVKDDDGE